ncbi:MAG: hypothetical protein H6Q73_297 [Firmicutes bacterium]|nr:hypothetical protein [Bacillota bacterium]
MGECIMVMLRYGSRILERAAPFGLVVGGVTLALAIPGVRKGLRAVAVTGIAGILSGFEYVKNIGNEARESLSTNDVTQVEADDVGLRFSKGPTIRGRYRTWVMYCLVLLLLQQLIWIILV